MNDKLVDLGKLGSEKMAIEAPVVSMAIDLEFSIWSLESSDFAPVEDIDESYGVETIICRQAQIF